MVSVLFGAHFSKQSGLFFDAIKNQVKCHDCQLSPNLRLTQAGVRCDLRCGGILYSLAAARSLPSRFWLPVVIKMTMAALLSCKFWHYFCAVGVSEQILDSI